MSYRTNDPLSGDLSGSEAAATVISITGATGVVNVSATGNVITWNAATTAPGLAQASESSATKGANLTLTPQQSTHVTDQGGGNLIVALQAPTGAGVEAGLQVTRGGTISAQMGPYLTAGTSFSAIWMGPSITPGLTNFSFLGNGSSITYLNAPSANSAIEFVSGGSAGNGLVINFNSSIATDLAPNVDVVTSLGLTAQRYTTLYSQLGINGGTNSGTNGTNLTISPEIGTSSGGNVQGGNTIIALQTPTGSGAEAFLQATRGGSNVFSAGGMPGSAGYAGLWGTTTPTGSNYLLQSNGTYLYVQAPSSGGSVFLGGGNATWLTLSSTSMSWAANTTTPTITQASESTATKGVDLTLTPQQSTHATDQGGGNLVVSLQTPTGAGVEAGLKVQRGASIIASLQAYPGASAYNGLWLDTSASTVSGTNYAILQSNTNGVVDVNCPGSGGTLQLQANAVTSMQITTSSISCLVPLIIKTNVFQDATATPVTTTDATLTTIYTDTAITASNCYDYVVTVVGIEPSTLDVYRADLVATYINTAGTVSVIGAAPTPLNIRGTTSGLTWGGASLAISGTQILVQVTGAASTTIHWDCSISRVKAV